MTDADGYSSTVTYNFDFGGVTHKQTPQPNTIQNLPGPEQMVTYDSAGRIDRATSLTNGAYVRYLYGPNYVVSLATVNNIADEAYTNTVFDGQGRTTGVASNHPGSSGGYKAQLTQLGGLGNGLGEGNGDEKLKTVNPEYINNIWDPAANIRAGTGYLQYLMDHYKQIPKAH